MEAFSLFPLDQQSDSLTDHWFMNSTIYVLFIFKEPVLHKCLYYKCIQLSLVLQHGFPKILSQTEQIGVFFMDSGSFNNFFIINFFKWEKVFLSYDIGLFEWFKNSQRVKSIYFIHRTKINFLNECVNNLRWINSEITALISVPRFTSQGKYKNKSILQIYKLHVDTCLSFGHLSNYKCEKLKIIGIIQITSRKQHGS